MWRGPGQDDETDEARQETAALHALSTGTGTTPVLYHIQSVMPPEDGTSAGATTTTTAATPGVGASSVPAATEQAFAALTLGDGAALSSSGSSSSSSYGRRRPRSHSSPTHRTVPLEEAVPSARVAHSPLPLADLCLGAVADNCASLVSIAGLDEFLAIKLLREILLRGKLDFRLCRVFMASEHEELSKAVASLNLYDALSCERPAGGHGLGSGCKR